MDKRFLHLQINSVTDELLLTDVSGEDFLCLPFHFELTIVSKNTSLPIGTLIGKSANLKIGFLDQKPQIYNGLIYSAIKCELGSDGFQTYKFLLRPWVCFLKDKIDSRVFCADQPMTIPEIVSAVFKNSGMTDFDMSKLQKNYPLLNYCIQYNESDFHFVSRLLNQAGIYYYFKHEENKHVMKLKDSGYLANNYPTDVSANDSTHQEHHIYNWKRTASSVTQKQILQDYDFTSPSSVQSAKATNDSTLKSEHYQYIPCSIENAQDQLSRIAKLCAQANQLNSNKFEGNSSYLNFYASTVFNLTGGDQDNGKYLIYSIEHKAKDMTGRPAHTNDKQSAHQYENHFKTYPTSTPFAPQITNHKPRIYGFQTATVTGPKDKEIYTDKFSRVKVQFHWDRYGKEDESSSYWIRVKQAWASEQYGTQFMPRAGQEVIVSFEDGDSDRPIVIGVVPNEDHMPPFDPIKHPTQSGFKTHSIQSKNSDDCNMLRFEDKANCEEIYLHAQKDMSTNVSKDSTKTIYGKSETTIQKGDHVALINDVLTIQAKDEIQLVCGGSEINITSGDITVQTGEINFNQAITPPPDEESQTD